MVSPEIHHPNYKMPEHDMNGTHVVNGANGVNGVNGVNGINGTNGVNGVDGPNGHGNDGVELWRHPHPQTTQFYAFQQHLRNKYPLESDSYSDLWQWSVNNPSDFWEEIWHYTGVKAHKTYESVRFKPFCLSLYPD